MNNTTNQQQQQQKQQATPFIIQNGNIYQLTTNIRNNTNICINNAIINNNTIITSTNVNNNNQQQQQQQESTPQSTQHALIPQAKIGTDNVVELDQSIKTNSTKTIIQGTNNLLKAKKMIYKADYQQCQQVIQQQYQQKQSTVLAASVKQQQQQQSVQKVQYQTQQQQQQQNSFNNMTSTPSIIILSSNKNSNEQQIITLNAQQQQQLNQQLQMQQQKQKICYIPVNPTNLKLITSQPQLLPQLPSSTSTSQQQQQQQQGIMQPSKPLTNQYIIQDTNGQLMNKALALPSKVPSIVVPHLNTSTTTTSSSSTIDSVVNSVASSIDSQSLTTASKEPANKQAKSKSKRNQPDSNQNITKSSVKNESLMNRSQALMNILNDDTKNLTNSAIMPKPVESNVVNNTNEPIKEQVNITNELLNDFLLPDSRIFKKIFKSSTEQSVQQGQLKYSNELLTFKTVKIGNLEHIIIDNVENLNSFKGNIDKLQTIAYGLALKLNKPVTIPAYLLIKTLQSQQGCLNDIENVLKEKNIKPLVISNQKTNNNLNTTATAKNSSTANTARKRKLKENEPSSQKPLIPTVQATQAAASSSNTFTTVNSSNILTSSSAINSTANTIKIPNNINNNNSSSCTKATKIEANMNTNKSSELKSLLTDENLVPYKVVIKEKTENNVKNEKPLLQSFNQLANDILSNRTLSIPKFEPQQQQQQIQETQSLLKHDYDQITNYITDNNNYQTSSQQNNINNLFNDPTLNNIQIDDDFNLDLLDSNSLFNLNDIDFDQNLYIPIQSNTVPIVKQNSTNVITNNNTVPITTVEPIPNNNKVLAASSNFSFEMPYQQELDDKELLNLLNSSQIKSIDENIMF